MVSARLICKCTEGSFFDQEFESPIRRCLISEMTCPSSSFFAPSFVKDQEVVQRIVYDLSDAEMIRKLRSSIGEAGGAEKDTALNYIGMRGSSVNVPIGRVKYAKDLLERQYAHVGTKEVDNTRKAFPRVRSISRSCAPRPSR